jgi:signal transduction histidine kinase/DNA-binding response OmpR family regulator
MKDNPLLVWTPLLRKIFLLVVSLFTIVFALTLLSIYQAAYNQAEREFLSRLNVGKNVFMNEVRLAKQHLDSSVETIAKDWALRSAIGQGEDTKSIRSVLFNHGQRINADIAVVVNKEFELIAQFGGEDVTVVSALAKSLDKTQQNQPWMAMIGDAPFIVSAEPIRAPATIGWLLVGKKLNLPFVERIKTLISLDINLLVLKPKHTLIALSTEQNTSMIEQELRDVAGDFIAKGGMAMMHFTQNQKFAVMPFDLFTNHQQQFVVVLQDSMSDWLKTRNLFMLELVPYFIAGVLLALLGSFLIARSITRPVGRLLKAAKSVASGNYSEQIKIAEKSELEELAREFGNMQQAVMEREQKIKDQTEEIRQTNTVKYQVEIAQKEQQLAASATEAKSRFLANVSHEIRTPLNSIIGYSEILSDPAASKDEKRKATLAVHNGGQYLLSIVNDVLDLAKIEAGKIQLNKQDTDLIELLDEVSAYVEGFAIEKHLNFKLKVHFPLPKEVNTDATRLKQILLNLCNNAIKFTDTGRVDLQVHLDAFRKRLIFVVSDTGPGMSDEQQLRLFTAFSQGNQSTSRKYGGTGLGLYISKQLTEMLGGHIKVTSQVGDGSQFAVYMPWVAAESSEVVTSYESAQAILNQKRQPSIEVPQLRANILCADDNEDNRQLVAYLVNKTGASLTLAEDGEQALKMATSQVFDLILMDMQMPNMDGLQATKEIIARGVTTPIIMLTANVDKTSKNDVLKAGVAEHFSKPIDTQSFYKLLHRYLAEDVIQTRNPIDSPPAVKSEFEQLIDNYKNSFSEKLVGIQQARDEKDWVLLKKLMHNLKGSAGSYGFQILSDLAALVEERITEEDYSEAAKYLDDLKDCMEDLSGK